jgi:tetratricopeptide (TPR) repeat protein
VIKQDREFEAAKVQEFQGDIFMTMDDTKNMDRAINHYKKSILIVANNFQLLEKLGKCFDRKREYKEAMQYYTKALMLFDNN